MLLNTRNLSWEALLERLAMRLGRPLSPIPNSELLMPTAEKTHLSGRRAARVEELAIPPELAFTAHASDSFLRRLGPAAFFGCQSQLRRSLLF